MSYLKAYRLNKSPIKGVLNLFFKIHQLLPFLTFIYFFGEVGGVLFSINSIWRQKCVHPTVTIGLWVLQWAWRIPNALSLFVL